MKALPWLGLTMFVAACASDATSSSSSSSPTSIEPDGFEAACEGAPIESIDGFTPSASVDWIALRSETGDLAPDAPVGPVTTRTISERGTACSGAGDRAACLAQLDAVRVLGSCPSAYGCVAIYFVYTRGDEVGVAKTQKEQVQLLYPVDTKAEAFFFATKSDPKRLQPTCEGEPTSRYRLDPNGGVDVTFIVHPSCADPVEEVTLHVREDGAIVERSRKRLDVTVPCAPNPYEHLVRVF